MAIDPTITIPTGLALMVAMWVYTIQRNARIERESDLKDAAIARADLERLLRHDTVTKSDLGRLQAEVFEDRKEWRDRMLRVEVHNGLNGRH